LQSLSQLNEQYNGLFGKTDREVVEGEKKSPTLEDNFGNDWGWFYSAKEVSTLEGIPLDKVYELPVVQFLNDLSYLKSKKQLDEYQYQQSASGLS